MGRRKKNFSPGSDSPPVNAKSGRVTLRIPPSLHAQLAASASEVGIDLNGTIIRLIQQGLPRLMFESLVLSELFKMRALLVEVWREANPEGSDSDLVENAMRLFAGEIVEMDNGEFFRLDPNSGNLHVLGLTLLYVEELDG